MSRDDANDYYRDDNDPPGLAYASSGSPVSINIGASNPQMIPNTGSLLDEYQYDDEETIDLINAIKNWNLKRPPNSPDHDGAGSASLSSTIGTNTTSDFDTLTAVSTNTGMSKGGYSYTASGVKAKATPKKTPLCNYSSKPSSLTARILQDHDPVSMNMNMNMSISSHSKIHGGKHKNYGSSSTSNDKEETATATATAKAPCEKLEEKVTKPPPKASTKTQETADSNSHSHGNTLQQLPQYVTTTQNENTALEILRKTAAELGLSSDELHAVLPTVQKLVKVITQHVPRLEKFVDQVCHVVIDENDNDNNENENEGGENFSTPQRKQKRRRNRKNMEARKERMDAAVHTLEEHWNTGPNRNSNGMVLKELSGNVTDMNMEMGKRMDTADQTTGADNEVILDYHDYQSYGVFTTAVKEHLSRRQRQFNFAEVKTPISCNNNKDQSPTSSQSLTDAEALDEINRLIEFEEKYSEKVNGGMDFESSANGGDGTVSPRSSSVVSPVNSDTVLRALLSTDTTTLRRFVLHFAYLFTVRQENILGKMNDLYVFSHEATSMIHGIKMAMGLSPSCPIHSVARKVVAVIESSQSTSA
jgi:hypothetical protein